MRKVNVIIACNRDGGIGYKNKLPWNIPEDLKMFKEKTRNSILIMGRKTASNIPYLKDRLIFCVSRTQHQHQQPPYANPMMFFSSPESAIAHCPPNVNIFVAGGGELYSYFFKRSHLIKKIYISMVNDGDSHIDDHIDTYVDISVINDWVCEKEIKCKQFVYRELVPYNPEGEYLQLLHDIMTHGNVRKGRNGSTKSLFSQYLKFDLRNGFPLLTTKKMFWRGVVEELLFFLRGETNTKTLEMKNVNIWSWNTSREFLDTHGFSSRPTGVMGPMYGYQWRHFGAPYSEETASPVCSGDGVDQFSNVIKTIRNDPHSRRIMMTTLNPSQVNEGVLPPCHSLVLQFYVDDGYIDCMCFNRSADMFLGLPFNIASTSLLISIIGQLCDLQPRKLTLMIGDAHIYEEHKVAVCTQLKRSPKSFPKLDFKLEFNDDNDMNDVLNKLKFEDFNLIGYKPDPVIKAKMVP